MRGSNSLAFNILNFFSDSQVYFSWWMKIPSWVCLICNLRKNDSLPIILILNSPCIIFANSLHKDLLIDPKIMLSTKIWTIKMSLFKGLMNNAVSTLSLLKPCLRRKLLNLSYNAHGAYFKLYKALVSLNIWSRFPLSSKPKAAQHRFFPYCSHLGRRSSHPFDTK